MDNRVVLYMLVGTKHLVNIVVSLMTLRDWWHGHVHIVTGCDDSQSLAERLCGDGRLGFLTTERIDYESEHKKDVYGWKTLMHRVTPSSRTVFVDADTTVVGDISKLFPKSHTDDQIRITSFAGWVSTGTKMSGRIEKWRDVMPHHVAGLDRDLVALQFRHNFPAINTGVIGFSAAAEWAMQDWRELTLRKPGQFINDELAMQLLFPFLPHIVMPDKYNASPIYSSEETLQDARVLHFHGRKNVKSPPMFQRWWPQYQRALRENYADIQEWTPGGDKRLAAFLKDQQCFGDEIKTLYDSINTEVTNAT